jgi:phosphocarrier protein
MYEKTVTVINKAGIHCRPSSAILTKKEEFPDTQISIVAKGEEIELASILGLLSLGLQYGDEVTVKTDGQNAEEACQVMADLFEYEFDFPQE